MAYTDRFPIVNNFLETRLSADCDEGETTLYLESVEALPRIIVGRDYIPLVLRDAGSVREIVYVDSVDVDSGAIVVKRGQEGTNSVAWSAGSYVYCTVTANSFQRMRVNGFAPLVDGTSGRPEISVTSSTTASIAGDYTAQIEGGMAVRVLAGDSVVEPNDTTMGAIHITGVEYSGGVTTLIFQNVTLPKNVSGLDLGLSTSAAPMYHPDTIVADNITTSQEGNVISADLALQTALQASQEASQEVSGQVALLDTSLRALIAKEVAKAMAAANAAQSSADGKLPLDGSQPMSGNVNFSGGGRLSRLTNGDLALIATNAAGDIGAQVQATPHDAASNPGVVTLVTRKADGTLGPFFRVRPSSGPEWNGSALPISFNGAKPSAEGDLSDINSSGSNWIRFSNGLQIVFVVTTASVASFAHTFAKPFSQVPSIQVVSSGKNRNAVQGGSTTGFTFADDGSGGAKTHYILAVGRWQ